ERAVHPGPLCILRGCSGDGGGVYEYAFRRRASCAPRGEDGGGESVSCRPGTRTPPHKPGGILAPAGPNNFHLNAGASMPHSPARGVLAPVQLRLAEVCYCVGRSILVSTGSCL